MSPVKYQSAYHSSSIGRWTYTIHFHLFRRMITWQQEIHTAFTTTAANNSFAEASIRLRNRSFMDGSMSNRIVDRCWAKSSLVNLLQSVPQQEGKDQRKWHKPWQILTAFIDGVNNYWLIKIRTVLRSWKRQRHRNRFLATKTPDKYYDRHSDHY